MSACVWGGVATATRSTSGSNSASVSDVKAPSTSIRAARFAVLSGVTTDQGPYGDPSSAQCAQVCEDTELGAHDDCAESGLAHVPPWDVQ